MVSYVDKKNMNRDMKVMRSMYYRSFNVKEVQSTDLILITIKKRLSGVIQRGIKQSGIMHLLNIDNIDEIVAAFRETFPLYKVMVVTWDDFSVKDQIKLLVRTKLCVSLLGDVLMNATYLPTNSAIIAFCRGNSKSKGVEHELWFDHLDCGAFFQVRFY